MVQSIAYTWIGWNLIFVFPPIFDECDIGWTACGNELIGYLELGISQKFLSHSLDFSELLCSANLIILNSTLEF